MKIRLGFYYSYLIFLANGVRIFIIIDFLPTSIKVKIRWSQINASLAIVFSVWFIIFFSNFWPKMCFCPPQQWHPKSFPLQWKRNIHPCQQEKMQTPPHLWCINLRRSLFSLHNKDTFAICRQAAIDGCWSGHMFAHCLAGCAKANPRTAHTPIFK